LNFSFGRNEFNVEGDNLLLEEKKVRYEEEGGVGGRCGFREESAGLGEGESGTMDDAMSEIVKDGRLCEVR
jgi:hypothetical protein